MSWKHYLNDDSKALHCLSDEIGLPFSEWSLYQVYH